MSVLDCIPISRAVRTTEPTILQEPVTLAEAKRQCGIADGNEFFNEVLTRLIQMAREQVETDTGIVCYTGSFTQKMSEWPDSDLFDLDYVRPITSLSSITYIDTDGTSQTLATTVYQLETGNVKQFVRLKYSQNWPALRGDINGITVTFVAGYSSVLTVPPQVKQAVLLRLYIEWLTSQERDASKQWDGYSRLIDRLGRRTYP